MTRDWWRSARMGSFVLGIAAVAVYEIVRRLGALPLRSFPSFFSIVNELVREAGTGEYWSRILHLLQVWSVGLFMGSAIGAPVGFLIGRNSLAHKMTYVFLDAVRPVPMMALFPIIILVLGTGMRMPILLVSLTTLWPMIIQARYGAQDIDPVAREVARSYGLGRFETFRIVDVPSVLPYVATGFRVSASIGILVAVGVSLLAGGEGVGNAIMAAQMAAATPRMYAYILTTGIVALVALRLVASLQTRALFWHPSVRAVD